MTFQVSDYKEKNFLDLNDDENLPIRPTYSKRGTWFKYFGYYVYALSELSQITL